MSTDNGRDPTTGKFREGHAFSRGNKGGQGRGVTKQMQRVKQMIADCVTDEDVKTTYAELMKLVRSGDLGAIHEFFDRAAGKAHQVVDVETTSGVSVSLDDIKTAILTVIDKDDWATREKLADAFGEMYRRGSSADSVDD